MQEIILDNLGVCSMRRAPSEIDCMSKCFLQLPCLEIAYSCCLSETVIQVLELQLSLHRTDRIRSMKQDNTLCSGEIQGEKDEQHQKTSPGGGRDSSQEAKR